MNINMRSILKNYGIIIAFILICVALSITSPVFFTATNLINVIRQTSIYGIMAVLLVWAPSEKTTRLMRRGILGNDAES